MTKPKKGPSEGTYRKLSKLLANAKDERGNVSFRKEAMRLFDKLCKKYNIDPSCIREDGYVFSDQFVLEITTDSKTFDSFLRVVCLLVGEFWGVQIRGRAMVRGNCILDFITERPKTPDEAARSYRLIKAALDQGWSRMQEAWTRMEAQQRHRPTIAYFVGGLGGRGAKPHKKSYVSGFYHLMKQRLAEEQRYRKAHRQFIEPPPVEPVALLPAPKPWVPPPPNPLALMVIPKVVRCCPDGIPFIRCPKCVEFDKYTRRKLATVKRALAKKTPPPPEPVEDPGPPDDPEYEGQRDDDIDPQSYMEGQSAARSMELNELKL